MGFVNLFVKEKRFSFLDVMLDEIAIIAFALLLAKLWTDATSLAWHWYAIIGVLAIIKPLIRCFKR